MTDIPLACSTVGANIDVDVVDLGRHGTISGLSLACFRITHLLFLLDIDLLIDLL